MKYFTSKLSKTLLLTGILAFALLSCQEDESVEGKKKAFKALTSEISELQSEADSLRLEIEELEGTKEIEYLNVTTYKTEEKPFNAFVEVQGTSQAENNVNLTTDIGGLVTAVYVDEGQYVSRGKTLIKLDDQIVRSQLQELNTSMSLAKDVFEKRKRLWEKNIGSEIEFLQAKNNYEGLQSKQATLNTQLSKMSIKSPISGKVDKISLKVGELASPGMPAVNVVNLSRMEVEVNVPEAYLGTVKKGDKVMVEFPTLNKEVQAKVKSVSQSINPNNRTFTAITSLPNKDGMLKPNLLAKIKILSKSEANAITIPSNLLQRSPEGYFVYTVVPNADSTSTVKEVAVEIGSSFEGQIIVTSGLKADDLLVKDEYRNVLKEDIVKVVAE